MQKLAIDKIVQLIRDQETFEAEAADHSFRIKINRYVPYCCMAVHDGHRLREGLRDFIAIDRFSRWYEEDPHTGDFIDSLPITLIALDSRYEYDLNRRPDDCIYELAWGKKVWKKTLPQRERRISLRKHENFYRVVHALIEQLNAQFGSCIVYDIHSYNYKRWDREVPLFNIGTERVDTTRFGRYIGHWQAELAAIKIKGVENTCRINDVFFGRGYNLEYITTHFPNVLVLATEIKKVYCDEETGENYPEIIRKLQQAIKGAVLRNAQLYSQEMTRWESTVATQLLDKKEDRALMSVDKQLYKLLKGFELLAYVNPINARTEHNRLKKNRYTVAPKFRYGPIRINPFELKQQLGVLPTQHIADVSIRNLYEAVINSYFDKIDLLAALNSRKFLYNSLRYFGRPSKKDLQNAQYILYLPPVPTEPKTVPYVGPEAVIEAFRTALTEYQIDCRIELSNKILSKVLVLNHKKTVQIRPDATFTHKEVNALIEHEIGVHMVTTQNSGLQKLKVFHLGLPVNTLTQEGLAILSEYLSGNLTLQRLKKLALRVVIADMMCNGADFLECYHYLIRQHDVASEDAFTIVTRIFRGGGFTKDYLYLRGFVKILQFWNANQDLSPLLVGKSSLEFYDTIREMIDRELLTPPKYITRSIQHPNIAGMDPIYNYLVSGLQYPSSVLAAY